MNQIEVILGAVATLEVVVDQTHGLHEGVTGGGSNEGPATLFEILAEGGGFRRGSESLRLGPGER